MNLPTRLLLWLAFAGIAAIAVYLWAEREDPALAARLAEAPRAVRDLVAPMPPGQAAPAPGNPAANEDTTTLALPDPSLPLLDDSDAASLGLLRSLLGPAVVEAWFNPQALVRRLVVTIDNLPTSRLSMRHRVLRAAPGSFLVTGPEGALTASPDNAQRYAPLVDALLKVDAATWVKRYRQWYPLLQQAYAEIGDPRQLFNDRLLAVIDHLVAVDVPASPPLLIHPGVLYRHADPALEARSVGAHALMRLGRAEAMQVQARLREIRTLLGGDHASAPTP